MNSGVHQVRRRQLKTSWLRHTRRGTEGRWRRMSTIRHPRRHCCSRPWGTTSCGSHLGRACTNCSTSRYLWGSRAEWWRTSCVQGSTERSTGCSSSLGAIVIKAEIGGPAIRDMAATLATWAVRMPTGAWLKWFHYPDRRWIYRSRGASCQLAWRLHSVERAAIGN